MAGVGSAEIDIIADGSQAQSEVNRFTRFLSSSFRGVAGVLAGIGVFAGVVNGIKSVVTTGATYEATMSKVQAVTRSTGEEMAQLDALAIELGEATKFSATEAAEGMAFLGQAGFDTRQIIESMPGLLSLAAAGGLELGRAADIASNILSGFNLEAGEMGRVSDVLALSAATANTSVEQMGTAMSYIAPVAAGAGLSMEEVAASVGILSNSGIQGERAGTALRGVISALQNPAGRTKKALEKLGLSMDDVNPSTNSLSEILKTLEGAGIDSATAMQLVGVEAGPGLISLLNTGSKGLETYTGELNNAKGAADQMAATMSDNLLGKWDEFTSRVETIGIVIYKRALPGLNSLLDSLVGIASYIIANIGPAIDSFLALLSNIWPTVQIIGGIFATVFGGLVALLTPVVKLLYDMALAFTGWEGFAPLVIGLGSALATLMIAKKISTAMGLLHGVLGRVLVQMLLLMNPATRMAALTNLWAKAQLLLNRAFLLNPFTLIIAAIVGLVAAFAVAYKKSETFRNIVNGVISSVKEAWSKGVEDVKAGLEIFASAMSVVWGRIVAGFNATIAEFQVIWGYIKVGFELLAGGLAAIWGRIVSGWNQTIAEFQALGSWFVNIWNILKTNVVNVATNLWNSIKNAFNIGMNFIRNMLAPFITFFVQSWENLKLFVLSIVTGFLSLLVLDFEGMRLAVLGIVESFRRQMENIWNLIRTLIVNAATNIKNGAIAAFEFLKNGVLKAIDLLKNGAINGWNNLKSRSIAIVKAIYNSIKNFFTNMKNWTINTVKSLSKSAISGFNSLKTGAINAVKNLYNSVVNFFKNLKTNATNSVKTTGTNVKNGFNSAKTNAVNAVRNLYNGVRDWIGKVPGKVTEMKNKMIKTIKGINLRQMGKDAIQGFINGITDKIGAVKDKVQSVVNAFKGKLESALKYGSPSKVMAQYGNWTIEGFVNGIDSLIDKVRDVAGNVADASIPNLDKTRSVMNQLNGLITGGSYDLSGVTGAAGIGSQAAKQPELLIEIPVNLDGREIARGTYRYTTEYQNRQSSIMRKFKEV